MSGREIATQVDVGVVSLQGLSAFGPILAAMSADDVNYNAIEQAPLIGHFFHINGKHAEMVPDLLQRCSSTRFDRLGLDGIQGGYEDCLIYSGSSSSMYPVGLSKLHFDSGDGHLHHLRDGRILLNGQYYRRVTSHTPCWQNRAFAFLYSSQDSVVPSSAGEHSVLYHSIRENPDTLDLRTRVTVRGQVIHVNLFEMLMSSVLIEEAEACDHAIMARLDKSNAPDVITTSVALPRAPPGTIAIVQTKQNPTAQLLACFEDNKSLLRKDCCLQCALNQAREQGYNQIIVGI